MPKSQPNLAELVQVLDNGTTLYDILLDLGWAKKEKARLHQVAVERYQKKKSKKVATSLVEREKAKASAEAQAEEDQVSGNQEDTA